MRRRLEPGAQDFSGRRRVEHDRAARAVKTGLAQRGEHREVFAGGVIAAANHVADFCAEVEVVTLSSLDIESVRQPVEPEFAQPADPQ